MCHWPLHCTPAMVTTVLTLYTVQGQNHRMKGGYVSDNTMCERINFAIKQLCIGKLNFLFLPESNKFHVQQSQAQIEIHLTFT